MIKWLPNSEWYSQQWWLLSHCNWASSQISKTFVVKYVRLCVHFMNSVYNRRRSAVSFNRGALSGLSHCSQTRRSFRVLGLCRSGLASARTDAELPCDDWLISLSVWENQWLKWFSEALFFYLSFFFFFLFFGCSKLMRRVSLILLSTLSLLKQLATNLNIHFQCFQRRAARVWRLTSVTVGAAESQSTHSQVALDVILTSFRSC